MCIEYMGGFPYEDDKMHFILSIRLCVIHCVFDSMHCIAMVTGILLLPGYSKVMLVEMMMRTVMTMLRRRRSRIEQE